MDTRWALAAAAAGTAARRLANAARTAEGARVLVVGGANGCGERAGRVLPVDAGPVLPHVAVVGAKLGGGDATRARFAALTRTRSLSTRQAPDRRPALAWRGGGKKQAWRSTTRRPASRWSTPTHAPNRPFKS